MANGHRKVYNYSGCAFFYFWGCTRKMGDIRGRFVVNSSNPFSRPLAC